jgi:homoserine kinase type II
MNLEVIHDVTPFWGITMKQMRPDLTVPGSPERCLERSVVEGCGGRFFLLEKIPPQAVEKRERIARALQYLSGQGLPEIHPYLLAGNKSVLETEGGAFQMSPYVTGIEFTRPDYVGDGWRGRAMADFLVRLRQASADMTEFRDDAPFSIKDYIRDFMDILRHHQPVLFQALTPVRNFLRAGFTSLHDDIPVAFCHGDYHVLNIIWGIDHLRGVIDWEFAGMKPDLYDAALLIGCIGVEDPEALAGDFVLEFIRVLKGKGRIDHPSWGALLEFVIAIRFAWMAEWLRKQDVAMVELEMAYLNLLIENADLLKEKWQI